MCHRGPQLRDGVAAVVLQPTRGRAGRSWSLYLALLQVGFDRRCVATAGRALLPPDFTLTPRCKESSKRYVSVPLSVFRAGLIPCESLGVTQHPARRSPDFPPRPPRTVARAATRFARPPFFNLARANRGVKQNPKSCNAYQILLKSSANPGSTGSPETESGASSTSTSWPGR